MVARRDFFFFFCVDLAGAIEVEATGGLVLEGVGADDFGMGEAGEGAAGNVDTGEGVEVEATADSEAFLAVDCSGDSAPAFWVRVDSVLGAEMLDDGTADEWDVGMAVDEGETTRSEEGARGAGELASATGGVERVSDVTWLVEGVLVASGKVGEGIMAAPRVRSGSAEAGVDAERFGSF
jgi:hypothetical protein